MQKIILMKWSVTKKCYENWVYLQIDNSVNIPES